jgi:hypothetical protein
VVEACRRGGREVYFVLVDGFVKVGYAKDPKGRAKHMNASSPHDARLLGSIPGDRHVEAYIHAKLKPHRRRGEWFYYNAEVAGLIEMWMRRWGGVSEMTLRQALDAMAAA